MFGAVCAGEESVEEAVAKEGFKAELAAIDDTAHLQYGGLYHTQSVGYCPLTTSPDPSGVGAVVGVCVAVAVGVGVCVGVCVDVGVFVGVGVSIAPLTPPVEDSGVAVGSGVDVGVGDGVSVVVGVGVWDGAGAAAGVAVGTTVAVGCWGVGDAVGVDVEAMPLRGSRAATVVMAMRASAMSPDAPYARRR